MSKRLKKPWKRQFCIKPDVEWLNVLQAKHNGLAEIHTKLTKVKPTKAQICTVKAERVFDPAKIPAPSGIKGDYAPKSNFLYYTGPEIK